MTQPATIKRWELILIVLVGVPAAYPIATTYSWAMDTYLRPRVMDDGGINMNNALLALQPFLRGWGMGQLAIAVVVIAAVVALVYVALRQFGIAIPQWVQSVFWIVIVAAVVIFAIRLVLGM